LSCLIFGTSGGLILSLSPRICDALLARFFSGFNDHADIVWKPDFQAKYDRFWRRSFEHEDLAQVDMRWLARKSGVFQFNS
jgi:hypothetical protein